MINKYQAGGAAPQGSILQEIAKLPQDQQKKIMTAFGKWAQAKGLNIQQLQGNEQALEQAMGQFLQEMQGAQKARLGAKLNYLRSIKGDCPEGQEVKYFREGGRVCKKCIEKGAAGAKAKSTGKDAVNEFKKKKACGGIKFKQRGVPEKKCNGGKAKKHQQGGSLSGIPFMQQGKDLPTAPRAEKRFKKNSYNITKDGNRETTTITSQTFGYNRNWPYFRQPATIQRIVENGDTAFVETPEHHIFTRVQPRTALRNRNGNTYTEYNPKYDKTYTLYGQANTLFNYPVTPQEYETLKRRFNTAWNLAK